MECFNFCVLLILTPIFVDCLQIRVDSPVNVNKGEVVIKAGDDLNLTCFGDTPLHWAYRDVDEYKSMKFNSTISVYDTKEDGVFYSRLQLQNAVYLNTGFFVCHTANYTAHESVYVYVDATNHFYKPYVAINASSASHVKVGETAILDCLVGVMHIGNTTIDWVLPNSSKYDNERIKIIERPSIKEGVLFYAEIKFKRLQIENVTKDDEGNYICNATDHMFNTTNYEQYYLKVFPNETSNLLTANETSNLFTANETSNLFTANETSNLFTANETSPSQED